MWTKAIKYPFFVGEYIEKDSLNEDGQRESTFILTGTTDKSFLSLESEKRKIHKAFPDFGITEIFKNGNGIAVGYKDSFYIPTDTEKLKRIQINLNVLEWSVN